MHIKTMQAKIKAAGPDDGLGEGQFEAIVSVFGNKDSYGDVVLAGAFSDDLARWAASGDSIPVIWSHDWADPFAHLGRVVKAEERTEGLWVQGQIEDMDLNPKAAQVYRLLKGRRVTQFSFAYDIDEGAYVEKDGESYYELRRLKVHEVGPCLLGVNQETELLAVKARSLAVDAKAGRVLSAKNYDTLREAHDAIGTVLANAAPEDDTEKSSTQTPEPPTGPETHQDNATESPEPAKDEEPDAAKSEEPTPSAAADLAAHRKNQLLLLGLNESGGERGSR